MGETAEGAEGEAIGLISQEQGLGLLSSGVGQLGWARSSVGCPGVERASQPLLAFVSQGQSHITPIPSIGAGHDNIIMTEAQLIRLQV